ncbi:conjugal transfer protein [Vibrio aerogenes]|uniref:conjugal transfer protein n=1 Tax=Vibrio aerogenes TaxID=92172 RepID=UPI0021C45116|nr:conjugal transfer protein [Vibrio aerogenes]
MVKTKRLNAGNKRRKLATIIMTSLIGGQQAMAGGLETGTAAATEIKAWLYGFLGVISFIYLMYLVMMAFLDKKPWSDVLLGVGKVAVAGAVLVFGQWAWGLWGS